MNQGQREKERKRDIRLILPLRSKDPRDETRQDDEDEADDDAPAATDILPSAYIHAIHSIPFHFHSI